MKLGILHVERDILKGLTAKEFRAWEMYCELEPFTETRQDYRVASILHLLYNMNRGKDAPAKQLKDFLLSFDAPEEDPKPETQEQKNARLLAVVKVLSAMHANDGSVTKDDTPGQVSLADPLAQAALEEQLAKARKAMH